MTGLEFIDAHCQTIDAPPLQVWTALLDTVARLAPQLPGWLVSAWGLQPSLFTGNWDGALQDGDTRPGFSVAELQPARLLLLRGYHRFASYELRLELHPEGAGATDLRALTSAAFPGLAGRAYRAAVISSRLHRVAVRRLLAQIARRADSMGSAGSAD